MMSIYKNIPISAQCTLAFIYSRAMKTQQPKWTSISQANHRSRCDLLDEQCMGWGGDFDYSEMLCEIRVCTEFFYWCKFRKWWWGWLASCCCQQIRWKHTLGRIKTYQGNIRGWVQRISGYWQRPAPRSAIGNLQLNKFWMNSMTVHMYQMMTAVMMMSQMIIHKCALCLRLAWWLLSWKSLVYIMVVLRC